MFAVKPMNCPGHMLIYKNNVVSYRVFYKNFLSLVGSQVERSGTLQGLFRVRVFTQDDAHIFCRKDQIEAEIIKVMNLIRICTHPSALSTSILKHNASDPHGRCETWDIATAALKSP